MPGAILRIHDLEIDTSTRVVKRGGKYIHLTPREYALLEYLAHRPGQVVRRSVIRKEIYGTTTSNVTDVYIRYLRKKIDDGHEKPLILTERGAGYLLRGEDS
jgi:DNA-binding response OmpR family regulator